MKKSYVFRLFNQFLNHEADPEELFKSILSEEHAQSFFVQIDEERPKIQNKLIETVFRIKDYRHERAIVQKYHEALILHINKAYRNTVHDYAVQTNTLAVNQHLLKTLIEILSFFREQFHHLLDNDQQLPITELLVLKEEIIKNSVPLNEKLDSSGNSASLRGILLNFWNSVAERIDKNERITLREANYIKMVMKDTEEKYETGVSASNCPSLHELLVYWNLNTIDTIRYFTQGLEALMDQHPEPSDRLDFARLQLKNILQMPELQDSIYDKDYPGVKDHFTKYLLNEIQFLERKVEGFKPIRQDTEHGTKRDPFKVLCNLSADQLGLIFRSAGRRKVIDAESWSAIAREVSKHISTKNLEHLSWRSFRGKGYNGEKRDALISVQALDEIKEDILDSI